MATSSYKPSRWLPASVAGAFAVTLLAAPVAAQESDTDAEFTVTEGSGDLTISLPAGPVDLGEVEFGGELAGAFGEVTVTDNRSTLNKTWEVHVEGTDFVAEFETGEGTETVTVAASDMTYNTLALGNIVGNLLGGVSVLENPTLGDGGGTAVTFTGGLLVLSGDASWTPTIELDTTDGAEQLPPGTYEGTITHSLLG